MHCQQLGCTGEYKDDFCNSCGAQVSGSHAALGVDSENISSDSSDKSSSSASDAKSPERKLQKISAKLKAISETEIANADLLQAAESLATVLPDRYEAWRAQADLWLTAIRQLEKRQLRPDDSINLLGVPLLENELRDAAEEALRQCAHHALTVDQRIALIDEANSVRRLTWF